MQLQNTEIDAMPGVRAKPPETNPMTRQPERGRSTTGATFLLLQNTAREENAFTVSIRPGGRNPGRDAAGKASAPPRPANPLWRDEWVRLQPHEPTQSEIDMERGARQQRLAEQLQAADSAGNTAARTAILAEMNAANEPMLLKDPVRHNDGSVTLYVPRDGESKVLISFTVPRQPHARAGTYPFTLVVRSSVPLPGKRTGVAEEIEGTLFVQPYDEWSVDLAPDERKVGLLRRGGEMDLVIRNQGNDWLYADLTLPKPKDLEIGIDTLRIAVPPALTTGEETIRRVPLRASTRLRTVRGEKTLQDVKVSLRRLRAPSVPAAFRPEDTSEARFREAETGAVEWRPLESSEGKAQEDTPPQKGLLYHPPIPASLQGFVNGIVANIKVIAAGVVLLYATYVIVSSIALNGSFLKFKAETDTLELRKPEKWVRVKGTYLVGAKFFVRSADDPNAPPEPVEDVRHGLSEPGAKPTGGDGPGMAAAAPAMKLNTYVKIDYGRWKGKKVVLSYLPGGWLSANVFGSLFKPKLVTGQVSVGPPAAPTVPQHPEMKMTVSGDVTAGAPGDDTVTIRVLGEKLAGKPASVVFGSDTWAVVSWKPDAIVARVPSSAKSAMGSTAVVTLADGATITPNGAINVIGKQPDPLPDGGNGGGAGGAVEGGGNAGNGGGGGGDIVAGGGGNSGTPIGGAAGSGTAPANGGGGGVALPAPDPGDEAIKSLRSQDYAAVIDLTNSPTATGPKPDLTLAAARAFALIKAPTPALEDAATLLDAADKAHAARIGKGRGVDVALFWAAMAELNRAIGQESAAAAADKKAHAADPDQELSGIRKQP